MSSPRDKGKGKSPRPEDPKISPKSTSATAIEKSPQKSPKREDPLDKDKDKEKDLLEKDKEREKDKEKDKKEREEKTSKSSTKSKDKEKDKLRAKEKEREKKEKGMESLRHSTSPRGNSPTALEDSPKMTSSSPAPRSHLNAEGTPKMNSSTSSSGSAPSTSSNTTSPRDPDFPPTTGALAASPRETASAGPTPRDNTEDELGWQEAIDILESQILGGEEEDEEEDLLVVAKREVKKIRESRERHSPIESEEDVQISSDEEDSLGRKKEGKSAAWEQLLKGMEKKAEQSSIELEWERTLDRSERIAAEKSREQEWEASLQRAEALAAESSKEEDWDRLLHKIERTALENTARGEWEQLLDFTEQVAAKESIVHDWEVTLAELEKRAEENTVQHEWEDTLVNAETRALKESQKEDAAVTDPQWAVTLNVYDVVVDATPLTTLNDRTLRVGFGIFYSGIVYCGREYSFSQSTGIYNYRPRGLRNSIHRSSISLGHSRGQPIDEVLATLTALGFTASNYHVIKKNSNHFSSELARLLSGQVPPNWLNKMVRACRFLDVFLPQATFRSDILKDSNRPRKLAEDDSLSLSDLKVILPDPQEKKALADWENALIKMGKSAEKAELPSIASSGDLESSDSAMEHLKKEIQAQSRHHRHHSHHRHKSHSKKPSSSSKPKDLKLEEKPPSTAPASQVVNVPNPSDSNLNLDLKGSQLDKTKGVKFSEPAKEPDLKKFKSESKAILERRLSELMVKLGELKGKEELIRQKSFKYSKSSQGSDSASLEGPKEIHTPKE